MYVFHVHRLWKASNDALGSICALSHSLNAMMCVQEHAGTLNANNIQSSIKQALAVHGIHVEDEDLQGPLEYVEQVMLQALVHKCMSPLTRSCQRYRVTAGNIQSARVQMFGSIGLNGEMQASRSPAEPAKATCDGAEVCAVSHWLQERKYRSTNVTRCSIADGCSDEAHRKPQELAEPRARLLSNLRPDGCGSGHSA